jgi:hypothetical protein
LINSIHDVILAESFLVCSHGLLNPVKHCRKDIFLHDQILRAANSAARKCGHTLLLLSIFGLVGLSVTFNKPVRDKTLDRIIWLLDAATILCVASLMFAA